MFSGVECGGQASGKVAAATSATCGAMAVFSATWTTISIVPFTLALLRFVPKEKRLEVMTYSPTLGHTCPGTKIVPEPEKHQFALRLDFDEPAK